MRTLGNIIWHFPFLGFVNAFATAVCAILFIATGVGAPIGVGLLEFSKFLMAPFGHAMVSKHDLGIDESPSWSVLSKIATILWVPAGLIMCAMAVVQIAGLFVSVIGIPVALVVAKSLGTYLNPVGKKCVPIAVWEELQSRKNEEAVQLYLGASGGAAVSPSVGGARNHVEPR